MGSTEISLFPLDIESIIMALCVINVPSVTLIIQIVFRTATLVNKTMVHVNRTIMEPTVQLNQCY